MPSSEAILAGATTIANEWRAVATAWHMVLGVVLAAVFSGSSQASRIAVGVFGLGVQLDYVLLGEALALLGALTSFTWSSKSRQSASTLHSTTAASRGMP